MKTELIFSNDDFEFHKVIQMVNNKDCVRYVVTSCDRACTYSIGIRLVPEYCPYPDSEIYEEIYITHGTNFDKLGEIKVESAVTYIEVLQNAVDFARRVEKYLKEEGLFI